MPKNKVDLGDLFYKQKGLCYWCKRPMVLGVDNTPTSATREHLVPQAHGGRAYVRRGRKHVKNIVAACKRCNNPRKTMDAQTFRSLINWQGPTPGGAG